MTDWRAHCFGHNAAAEIISVLKGLYPRFQILDTSFPMLTFPWFHDDVIAVFHRDRVSNLAEQEFYARFRQAGGHMPLLRPADIGPHSFSHSGDASQAAKVTVVACHSCLFASLLEFIGDVSPATVLLLTGPDEDEAVRAGLAQMNFVGGLTICFNRAGETETFRLLAQAAFDREAIDRVRHVIRAVAVDARFDVSARDPSQMVVSVELPPVGYQPPALTISPTRLIHDGSRSSEGRDDYAWLWIGKERHLRMLLGRVPAHFGRVRIVVPNAVSAANLRTARLALNGQLLASDIEVWQEGVGAITAAFSYQGDVDHVLGFSIAGVMPAEAGTPVLAACIDRVEFQA